MGLRQRCFASPQKTLYLLERIPVDACMLLADQSSELAGVFHFCARRALLQCSALLHTTFSPFSNAEN